VAKKTFREISRATPEQRIAARQYARAEIARLKLKDLRRARRLSQEEMAERLGTNQGAVSRIEHQTDMYVRSLRRYIEAAGGSLVISAYFPDADPIELEMFEDIGEEIPARQTQA
jgi:transcriptional regulator with XRE-family HTH domain